MSGIYHQNKEWANVTTPNPAGTANTDLTKLGIDGVNYNVKDADAVHADDDEISFTEASERTNIASGDTLSTMLGKIKKFFSDLKTVAFSGSYNDLTNKPTIPAAQVNSDWDASSGVAQILHKPALATVATSGSYNDLSNKPTIPTVNNGTLTIQKNGTQVATFSANQSGNATANITVPEVEETDTTNSTPYLYRASQNSGDRCYLRQLVGASFGVNQLATFSSNIPSTGDGITYTASQNNSVLLTGTCNNTSQRSGWFKLDEEGNFKDIVGHKVLFFSKAISGTASKNIKIDLFISGTPQYNIGDTFIKQVPQNYRRLYWSYESGCVFSNYRITFNCIDLTQMFGTAIADYVYSLETTAAAGAGVEWLKSYGFFTESYYPYNTGSFVSVQTSGKVNSGKNIWNGAKTDLYYINNSGVIVSDSASAYSDKIPAKPNTSYTMSGICVEGNAGTKRLHAYDVNGNWISMIASVKPLNNNSPFSLTGVTPSNCAYLVMSWYGVDSWATHDKEIQLELGSTATPYEPHITRTTQLPNIELRGVPKLVDNEIVYDGDVENADGSVERKYGIVDLSSLNWIAHTGNKFYSADDIGAKGKTGVTCICSKYQSTANVDTIDNVTVDKSICLYSSEAYERVYIKDTSYSTAAALKTALDGVYLVYELTNSTTEQTTPIQNPQIYNSNGTEQFIDNRTVPIPVGHNSEYVNLPDWMEDGYYKDFRQRVDEHIGSDGNFNGNALTATLATKATQDGDGNNISSTYWKKTQYPKTGKSAGGSATAAITGYRDVKTIEVDQGGVFLVIAFVKFSGGTGKRAVLITNSNDNPYAQTWDDSTIASGDTKQIVCCHNLVVSDSSVPIQIKLRVYTANSDTTSISGTIAFIRLQ